MEENVESYKIQKNSRPNKNAIRRLGEDRTNRNPPKRQQRKGPIKKEARAKRADSADRQRIERQAQRKTGKTDEDRKRTEEQGGGNQEPRLPVE